MALGRARRRQDGAGRELPRGTEAPGDLVPRRPGRHRSRDVLLLPGLAGGRLGGKKAAALPLFTDEYRRDLHGFARRWFREFFARMAAGSVLVLDNLHEAAGTSELRAAFAKTCSADPGRRQRDRAQPHRPTANRSSPGCSRTRPSRGSAPTSCASRAMRRRASSPPTASSRPTRSTPSTGAPTAGGGPHPDARARGAGPGGTRRLRPRHSRGGVRLLRRRDREPHPGGESARAGAVRAPAADHAVGRGRADRRAGRGQAARVRLPAASLRRQADRRGADLRVPRALSRVPAQARTGHLRRRRARGFPPPRGGAPRSARCGRGRVRAVSRRRRLAERRAGRARRRPRDARAGAVRVDARARRRAARRGAGGRTLARVLGGRRAGERRSARRAREPGARLQRLRRRAATRRRRSRRSRR